MNVTIKREKELFSIFRKDRVYESMNNTVVLCTETSDKDRMEFTGVVLNSKRHEKSSYSTKWKKTMFNEFKGKITIEQ